MEKMFRQLAKSIRIYIAKESILDPFEKNISRTDLNPISIKAIVSTVTPEKLSWKFYGLKVIEAKELIIEQNNLNLIRMSHKIEIDGINFLSYKENVSNFTIYSLDDKYVKITLWRIE